MLQSQFGITPFAKVFGAVGVTDQLSVWGDLWITKQRQVASLPAAARWTATRMLQLRRMSYVELPDS